MLFLRSLFEQMTNQAHIDRTIVKNRTGWLIASYTSTARFLHHLIHSYRKKLLHQLHWLLHPTPHHRAKLLIVDPSILQSMNGGRSAEEEEDMNLVRDHPQVKLEEWMFVSTWSASTSDMISLIVSASPTPCCFMADSSSSLVMNLAKKSLDESNARENSLEL